MFDERKPETEKLPDLEDDRFEKIEEAMNDPYAKVIAEKKVFKLKEKTLGDEEKEDPEEELLKKLDKRKYLDVVSPIHTDESGGKLYGKATSESTNPPDLIGK